MEIARRPRQKIKDCRYPEEEIRRAAGNVARCWLMVGTLGAGMERFKRHAAMLSKKAEVLMGTYGLTPEDISGGWGK